MTEARAKNPHYYKSVKHLRTVDIYRAIALFGVTHPCLAHAAKKILVPGIRTGGKGAEQDIKEAIQSLQRWLEMLEEDRVAEAQESEP